MVTNFLFVSMLNLVTLVFNNKVINWVLIGISQEKIKAFGPSLVPVMSNI